MCNPDRLLVVDDDCYNRDMLLRRLERRGYEVMSAADGREALSMIGDQHFDLILLDNMMPGMSGLDLLRLLRATYSEVELPVIMVTAQSESESVVEALKAGANDYVVKPVDFPVAAARIHSELSRRSAAAALRASEERYALAARSGQDGLWDWDLRRGTVYYCPRWKRMLGYGDGELSDSPEEWFGLVREPDRTHLRNAIDLHVSGAGTEWSFDYRVTRRDGEIRWMRSRAVSSRDRTGAVVRLTGSQSDITTSVATDPLTGLHNRMFLIGEIEQALIESPAHPFALLCLDLDEFKLINDSLGHMAGDRLLRETGSRLKAACACFRHQHPATRFSPARFGGDEFTILVSGTDQQVPAELASFLISDLGRPVDVGNRDVFSGVSIGLVCPNSSYRTAEEVLRDADTALNLAKRRGRNRLEVFDQSMRARALARLDLGTGLRRALDRNELTVWYQVKVDLRSGEVIGFEALSRWFDSRRGPISPVEFIPVAEETGLIVPLGMWALSESCRQMGEWTAADPAFATLSLSVNLSPRQFSEPDLCDSVARILAETGFDPNRLCFEITESVLVEDLDRAADTLKRLKALGISLKLDDFGTGYSSLRYLSCLPFDTLKIDRSFVSAMGNSQESAGIVKTIIALARDLHMDVVAEGIEREDQMIWLRDLGCQYGQGFYFGRPAPPDDIMAALLAGRSRDLVLPSLSNGDKGHGH